MNQASRTREDLDALLADARQRGQVFAVIDAASFDYLQDTLHAKRLTFDTLYLDELDAPAISSGPHLVHPTGPRQIAAILDLVGDSAGCVWWVMPEGRGAGGVLRRHLRGLNMIEIPRRRFDAPAEEAARPGHEPVLFRHGDGNAVDTVLAVLDPAQVSRLLGPALEVIVNAAARLQGDGPAMRRVAAADPSIETPRGMLRLSPGQYEAIADARLTALRPAVDRYLRRATPERRAEHGSTEYETMLTRALATGRDRGLRGTQAFCRYALMAFASKGQSLDSGAMERLLVDPVADDTADMRLERAFKGFVGQLESQA